ncbi:MAG: sensor histidine kinase [Betaproteobacteria bacterium]
MRLFASESPPSFRRVVLRLLGLVAGNTLIALFLTVVGFGGPFVHNLIYSQCIGLSIVGLLTLVLQVTRHSPLRLVGVVVAIFLGAALGQLFGHLLTFGEHEWSGTLTLQSLLIGLFFGGIGSVGFILRERNRVLEIELQARELQRLEAEKRGIEAQLKMLQAQIEPHFLFNTLANLAGLIPADPALASRLLEALNRYLRASLKRTRAEGGSLGDEMDLLAVYLEVLKIRLGSRLEYGFDVAEELRALPFPPMLLQPLVENAVRHGIEPQVAGGRIDISASRGDDLRITVEDTGAGFGEAPGGGIGLANIRARLDALFGAAGRLEIAARPEGGAVATLRIPA